MKRMTTIPQAELIKCTNCSSYDVCFGDECGVISYAIEVLKQYEDTGLTPEQIIELKERDTAKDPEEFDGHWYKCPTCGKYAGGLKGNFCHVCGQVEEED